MLNVGRVRGRGVGRRSGARWRQCRRAIGIAIGEAVFGGAIADGMRSKRQNSATYGLQRFRSYDGRGTYWVTMAFRHPWP